MYSVCARPVRDLRNNYAELARMTKESKHIIVTNNGKDETVLMGIEDYNLCREFLHTRYVLSELEQAQAEAKSPDTSWLSHNEVFERFRKKYGYEV